MGLRISEVVTNPMGEFFRRRDRDGQERWWLTITGKGDKKRLLPATEELMVELTRYRHTMGWPPCPTPASRPRSCSQSVVCRGR